MALVNWNPVTAANFSESNALRLAAQQQLAGGIKGIGDTAVAFNDATGKANTDILLNSLVGQRTPEAAAAAIQAAKAQAGGMYSNYDQAAFRSAAEALPKSAADAQELDLQIADKPYLQAATLAFSKKDPAAVAHFASQVKSRDGIAQITNMISGAQTMSVQDAGVANAEGTLKEKIRSAKADEAQAKINGITSRIAANKSGSGSSSGKGSLDRVIANARLAIQKAATDSATSILGKSQNTPESNLAYQTAMNGGNGERIRTLGNVSGKHVDEVLKEFIPGYVNAGSGLRAKVLDYIWAANTAQTTDGAFGGLFQTDLSDAQIKTLGATALADFAANDRVNLARAQQVLMEKGVAQTRDWMDLHGIPQESLTDDQITALLTPGANAQPDTVNTPPPKPKEDPKAAEQYLKDKAELAAREAKRQAGLAAGKGNPTSVKGGVVTTPRYPVSTGNPITNDPILKAAATAIKSAGTAVANTTNAAPNTSMLQGGGNGFLDRPVIPVNTSGLTTIAKGVSNLATTSVPEAIGLAVDAYKAKPDNTPAPTKSIDVPKAAAKVAASIKTAPSDISAVTDVFAQVAAAQAKAKVPSPVTPTVIKTTVKQGVQGTTPIAKPSESSNWESMFKKVADKANEIVAGKGWSNDPKNQDQYENGLVVDGETTQPSSKHEINIFGMWGKDNSIKGQFLGDYDTFKGYAVKVKVKGGGEYVIPLTYDEIAAHTGANREDILRAGTNDIRSNAVVQRRVYRTALDKLTTQLSNSKGK